MVTPSAAAPRLREHLPLAVGAVVLVTLAAFLDRAVGTALPAMLRDLGAVRAFGLVNAAPAATFLAALSLGGAWADRVGAVPVLRAGAATFAVSQALVGSAPSASVVVLGRLAGGVGEAWVDVSLLVLVAQRLPATLRPRMFAVFSAAWVLPSVLGPFVTGVVTERLGWRWVFLGVLPLLPPAWLLLRTALGRAQPLPGDPAPQRSGAGVGRPRTRWAVAAGAAVFALNLAGTELGRHPLAATVVVLASAAGLVVALLRLLPAGTLAGARGIPAVVATRGAVFMAFSGVGAFLPLLLTLVHGFRPALAGTSLAVTGVAWALGSWLQGRDLGVSRPRVLRVGVGVLTVGLAGTLLLVVPGLSPWPGLLAWSLAGVGMGIASSTLSVLQLDLAPDAEQGRTNAAAQTCGVAGYSLALALGGSLVALQAPDPGGLVFGVVIGAGVVSGALGWVLAARVSVAAPGTPA